LRVVPEVSNIDSKDSQKANGAEYTANVYSIRRADTHVMIPSGNTLVMGGLINDTTSQTLTKVPLLGDAPAIGGFFRHQKNVRNKQNLIIFITPTVVDDNSFAPNGRGTDFLKTKYEDVVEEPETVWNSAHPADWTKPHGGVKSK
jgi:general secretion pathway protein D